MLIIIIINTNNLIFSFFFLFFQIKNTYIHLYIPIHFFSLSTLFSLQPNKLIFHLFLTRFSSFLFSCLPSISFFHSYRYCLQINYNTYDGNRWETDWIYNQPKNRIGSGMQNPVPKPPHALVTKKQPFPVKSINKIPTLCSIPAF